MTAIDDLGHKVTADRARTALWRSCPSGARLVTLCSASEPADSAAGPSQRRISMLGLPRPAKANPCWTLHDLRRSFVMHVSELGFAQPHALGAIVNHVRGSQGWRGRCP